MLRITTQKRQELLRSHNWLAVISLWPLSREWDSFNYYHRRGRGDPTNQHNSFYWLGYWTPVVEALRFICGSGTRIFHLRMSGPQMGLGVSPIIKMPQWWSRRWPPWDAPPHRQKVALCLISLRVHAISLRVAPMPAVRCDLNGGLPTCIRFIIYQEYMVIVYFYVFCLSLSLSLSLLLLWYAVLYCVQFSDRET